MHMKSNGVNIETASDVCVWPAARWRIVHQISSIGMRQIVLPVSSTTETEQPRPANSGRVARNERASSIASI